MNITLRQLQAFMAVYKTGSFTKAAEEMFLTQSALSSLVKELENNLNLNLFHRTTRQLQVSDAGKRLLPYAIRINNEIKALNRDISDFKNLETGHVRISIAQQLASSLIPTIITQFNELYPNIHILISDSNVERVIENVITSEVEIGIGPDREIPTNLTRKLIFTMPFCVAVPQNHKFNQYKKITWQDIRGERIVTLRGSFINLLVDALPQEISRYLQQAENKVSFMTTAFSMVKNNFGITFCMPYAKEWATLNGLNIYPLEEPLIERDFYLYTQKDRVFTPATEKFVNFSLENIHTILAS